MSESSERAGTTGVYWISLALGGSLAIYLYAVAFNRFSETELMNYSGAWLVLIAFGLAGLFMERAARKVAAGDAADLDEGLKKTYAVAPLVRIVFVPLLFFNMARTSKSAFAVTLFVTIAWAVLLYLFLAAIFPAL